MSKLIILGLLFTFLQHSSYSQSSRTSVSKDSLAVWEIRKIHHSLVLDSIQTTRILSLILNKLSELESLSTLNTTLEERKESIKYLDTRFENRLKELLSSQQYKKYKEELEKQKVLFNQRMKQKGVKVEETYP